jgi:hypothetical protein
MKNKRSFEIIGKGKPYSNASTLYYDGSNAKEPFVTHNYWDGSLVHLHHRFVKWYEYDLTPLGQELKSRFVK